MKRLKSKEVLGIVAALSKPNYDVAAIAEKHGVSQATVYSILSGRTWAHLTGAPECFSHRRENPRKLTESQVRVIVRAVESGQFTQSAIAKSFSVTPACVSRIMSGSLHSNVTGIGVKS